jgi:prepilin-type N-terminal cleavage/methylation domain-containing protein
LKGTARLIDRWTACSLIVSIAMRSCREQTHLLRSAGAFSLIELVLVMVIISIFAAMAVPRFAGALTRRRVDAAVHRVQADLALAQRRAKLLSASQTVEFAPATNSYTLVGMEDPDHAGKDYTVVLSEEPYGTLITSADLGGDMVIVFDGYGAPDSGGTIAIQLGDTAKTITVQAATGGTVVADAEAVNVDGP